MTVSALKELGMLPDYVLNKVFLVTINSSTISLALVTQSTVVDWILKQFAIIYTIAWLHYPTLKLNFLEHCFKNTQRYFNLNAAVVKRPLYGRKSLDVMFNPSPGVH